MMGSKKSTKRLVYKGCNPKLQTGVGYTMWEYAEALGRDYKRLHSKLSRQLFVTDEMLQQPAPAAPLVRLEHREEILSDKWLRKNIRGATL